MSQNLKKSKAKKRNRKIQKIFDQAIVAFLTLSPPRQNLIHIIYVKDVQIF